MSEDMEAGPELDALVAREVMGWWIFEQAAHMDGDRVYPHCYHESERRGRGLIVYDGVVEKPFRPSTDIAAAFSLLDRFDGWKLVSSPVGIQCVLYTIKKVDHPPEMVGEDADTAPLAICRAALKSVRAGRSA
jgi:hypothetical protein